MEKSFLEGKRIAITANLLEQKEHRGSASVIKSLIRLFSKYGADIYLITGFNLLKSVKNNEIYKEAKLINNIDISDIKLIFENGRNDRELFRKSLKFRIKLLFELLINSFELTYNKFNLKFNLFKINNNRKTIDKFDSRLGYLADIKGFISIKNIFHICRSRSMRLLIKDPKLDLSKTKIDLIISSNPLSLKYTKRNNAEIIQLIQDAIPLQWAGSFENPKVFTNTLFDAHKNCKCFYVSQESKKVVLKILNIKNNKSPDSIIHPLPSLNLEILKKAYELSSIRSIKKPFIIFNSSFLEYKKVENAINYFNNSNLPKRNFLLCLAGKLHKSDYCEYIKNICRENKNILLLDYVSEIEKAWLFLNSSLLISTSLYEGFGIPLLDALSINLSAIANDIPSYREIKAINRKNRIKLIQRNNEKIWINYLNKLESFDIKDSNSKLLRIKFFKRFINYYEESTLFKFRNLINQKQNNT